MTQPLEQRIAALEKRLAELDRTPEPPEPVPDPVDFVLTDGMLARGGSVEDRVLEEHPNIVFNAIRQPIRAPIGCPFRLIQEADPTVGTRVTIEILAEEGDFPLACVQCDTEAVAKLGDTRICEHVTVIVKTAESFKEA